jgi:hypothetical protein
MRTNIPNHSIAGGSKSSIYINLNLSSPLQDTPAAEEGSMARREGKARMQSDANPASYTQFLLLNSTIFLSFEFVIPPFL